MDRRMLVILALAAMPVTARSAELLATPENYRAQLAALKPGDVLQLASGTYTQGLPLESMAGTAQSPIVVRGPEDQSAVFTARSCCNTVQLNGTSHVEIRNLTLDGQNLDGPFGVDSRGASHHITLENLRIINHGADQQIVGISTKGPAWNWIIRRNTIIRAGTGIYLGNSDGTQPFVAGIIENNLIVDSVGYNLQIKHQVPRPTNVGLPGGPSRTLIRDNVFSKRDNGASGGNARPNVLVGHLPLSGPGTDDLYDIHGNFFHENPTEALFQGEGNLALYNNLFVNGTGDAVNIQPQNDRPRTVTVLHNTVVASGSGIRVTGGAAGTVQRIVGNAVFAASPIIGPNALDNVTGSRAEAAVHLVAPLAQIGALDLFPKVGALTGPAIDLAPYAAFSAASLDFNARARSGASRGAYEGSGSNPGWSIALAIKPSSNAAPAPVPTPRPVVSLSANATSVPASGRSTLTWSATDATSCLASGGWSGPRVTSGSESVGPLGAGTAFRLECTGPGGSQQAGVEVRIVPAPSITLAANPSSVAAGSTVTLQWVATDATTCEASGGWSGVRSVAGTEVSTPLQRSSTFSLQCTGAGGTHTLALGVAVIDPASPSGSPRGAPAPSAVNAEETAAGGGGSIPPGALWCLCLAALRTLKGRTIRGR